MVKEMSDCIISKNGKGKDGYPTIYKNGKTLRENRVVLEDKLGRPIKKGYEAAHSCDNPGCINPDHLLELTHRENLRDARLKGRKW